MYRHICTQSFTQVLGYPLDSCFGCARLYFLQEDLLLWTVFFANDIFERAGKGVYASALIKKRRYWPKSVPGDLVEQNFEDK